MIQPQEIVQPGSASWFCLQGLPKREHIAAARLRKDAKLEVFLPRIRYRRPTCHGPAWVTEALFPGYLFARFDVFLFRLVQATPGVRCVVHFGTHWPTIPEQVIAELRTGLGNEEIRVLSQDVQPGETVEVADGAFAGLQATVSRVMPGRRRVSVLLDFLGRQTAVELDPSQLVPDPKMLRNQWAPRKRPNTDK
jgi:transcriptional antiterminator RfaH